MSEIPTNRPPKGMRYVQADGWLGEKCPRCAEEKMPGSKFFGKLCDKHSAGFRTPEMLETLGKMRDEALEDTDE